MSRDIIFGGLYLSRVIQIPFIEFGVIEDKCRSFRDDIFYGVVSREAASFLLN